MTKAEQCLASEDPYQMAVDTCSFTSKPSDHRKVFIFADRSTLAFKVTYEAADIGSMEL